MTGKKRILYEISKATADEINQVIKRLGLDKGDYPLVKEGERVEVFFG